MKLKPKLLIILILLEIVTLNKYYIRLIGKLKNFKSLKFICKILI